MLLQNLPIAYMFYVRRLKFNNLGHPYTHLGEKTKGLLALIRKKNVLIGHSYNIVHSD